MAIYPVFLRPIEITADNDSFSVDAASAGSYASKTIPNGTYAHVGTLLHAMQVACASDPAAYTFSLTADFKVRIQCAAAFDLRFDDTDLAALLGFTGNITNKTDTTATYTPEYCWLPANTLASQDYFRAEIAEEIDGVSTRNGAYIGHDLGSGTRIMDFVFQFQPAAAVSAEFGEASFSLGGNTYYVDEDRCFDTFYRGASAARASASNVAHPAGFFFYRDRTDVAVADTATAGGVRFSLSSGADDHVFCAVAGRYTAPSAAVPNGRSWWNVEFSGRSCALPSGVL